MAPLIKARPGFGKKLVAPFDVPVSHMETIYLVSRTEQARDRRIGALRRWIVEAVGRAAKGERWNVAGISDHPHPISPPRRLHRRMKPSPAFGVMQP